MADINVVLQALRDEVGDKAVQNAMLTAEVEELRALNAQLQAKVDELTPEEEKAVDEKQ